MLKYFRKWSIELKRRRLRKERAMLQQYVSIEQDVRGDGQRCHNCKAPLTGPFCHICGQRDDDLRRPIWTFFRELLDAIFDTDSKIIKTIVMLLLIPGGLSRGFMEGKRARFLPPFRLYIVLLFVFFSTLSLADVLILDIGVKPKVEMVEARQAAEAAQEMLEEAREAAADMRQNARELQIDQAEDENEFQMELAEQLEENRGRNDQRTEELRHKLKQRETERQRNLAEILRSTAQLEARLVKDGLVKPGELTEQLQDELRTVPGSIAVPVTVTPVTPTPPTIVDAIDAFDKGDNNKGGEILEGLFSGFTKQIADGEETQGGPQLRAAQERVRELLNDPNRSFSAAERESLEGVLAMDVQLIEQQAEEARRQAGLDDDDGDDGGFNLRSLPYDFSFAMFVSNDNEEREGIKQEDLDYIMEDPKVPPMVKKATEGLLEALQSPREFNKLFNEWLPWAMVVLLPVFAFILRIFHWGKRRYYLNQLVFALHFHSFLFVMLTVFAFVLPAVGGDGGFDIFWIASSFYLIIALKVGQDQGWIRAFLKAGFIWVTYFFIMMTTLAIIMFIGLSDSSITEFIEMFQKASADKFNVTIDPPTPADPS